MLKGEKTMGSAANNFTANRLCPGYHRLKSQNMKVGKTYECIPENYIGFYTEDLKKYGCAFKYEYKCTLFEEPTSQQNIPQQLRMILNYCKRLRRAGPVFPLIRPRHGLNVWDFGCRFYCGWYFSGLYSADHVAVLVAVSLGKTRPR